MAPLRPLLKADAVWPASKEQLAAIEGLKGLVVEDHLSTVPNEQAAIIAARAWQNGDPPAGCPYEAGADTLKIAMGGLLGQASTPGGKLHVLMYWNAPLSPAQSQWPPFEQECRGLVPLKRQICKHFGRIGSHWALSDCSWRRGNRTIQESHARRRGSRWGRAQDHTGGPYKEERAQ